MRQIYTSPRMENIERVVALFDESGIQTTVRNHEVWRAASWKRFSYADRADNDAWPQVWVVKAEDHTRARRILRDAGVEPSTHRADELAAVRLRGAGERRRAVSWRWKLLILALIVAVLVLIASRTVA
ncbi:MAG: hypothetical protein WBW61_05230 [Rhodanobacteraceae bacterium]